MNYMLDFILGIA